jgi:hypothetical protein
MTVWTAVIGFFSALPEIISNIKKFAVWINQVSGNDIPGFLNRTSEAFMKLDKAKTEVEYEEAARAIRDAIRRRPG